MFSFNRKYFFITIVLFVVEVLIALFVRDRFVRPYFGDYLVVILIYCFVKSFIKVSSIKLSIAVFLFACCIEVLQYLRLVDRLGLADNVIAKTVIGYGFEWWDIVAYALGTVTIYVLEKISKNVFQKSV